MTSDEKLFPVEPLTELDDEDKEISDLVIELLNNNNNRIDWQHWLSLALWKPVEAIYLLNLRNPINREDDLNNLAIFGVNSGYGGAIQKVNNQVTLAERDMQAGILNEVTSPCLWIEWAQRKGIKVPTQLSGLLNEVKNIDTRNKWEIEGTLEYKCRQMGEKYILSQTEKPSIDAIAKYLEKELKNKNLTGKRGDYWDWQTIKRQALKGITGRKARGRK